MRSHASVYALWAALTEVVSASIIRIESVSDQCQIQKGQYDRLLGVNALAQDALITPTEGLICTDGHASYGATKQYLVEFLPPNLDAEQRRTLRQWQQVCDALSATSLEKFEAKDHFLCPLFSQCSHEGDANQYECIVFSDPDVFSATNFLSMEDFKHVPLGNPWRMDLWEKFDSQRQSARNENRPFKEELRKVYHLPGPVEVDKEGRLQDCKDCDKVYKERVHSQTNLFSIKEVTGIIYRVINRFEILSSLTIEHKAVMPANIWVKFERTTRSNSALVEKVLLGGLGFTAIGDDPENRVLSVHALSDDWKPYVHESKGSAPGATSKMYSLGRIYMEALCGRETIEGSGKAIEWNNGPGKFPKFNDRLAKNPCAPFLTTTGKKETDNDHRGYEHAMEMFLGSKWLLDRNQDKNLPYDRLITNVSEVLDVPMNMNIAAYIRDSDAVEECWQLSEALCDKAKNCNWEKKDKRSELKVCKPVDKHWLKQDQVWVARPFDNVIGESWQKGKDSDSAAARYDIFCDTPNDNNCFYSGPACRCVNDQGKEVEDGNPDCSKCWPDAVILDYGHPYETKVRKGKTGLPFCKTTHYEFRLEDQTKEKIWDPNHRMLLFALHLAEKIMHPNQSDIDWSGISELRKSYKDIKDKPIFAILDLVKREMVPVNKKIALNWNVYQPVHKAAPLEIEFEYFDVELWPQLTLEEWDTDEKDAKPALVGSDQQSEHTQQIHYEIYDDQDQDAFNEWTNFLSTFKIAIWPYKFEGNDCGPPRRKEVSRRGGFGGLDQQLEHSVKSEKSERSKKSQKSRKSKKSKSKKQSKSSSSDSETSSSRKSSSSKKNKRGNDLKQGPREFIPPEVAQSGLNQSSGFNLGSNMSGQNHVNQPSSSFNLSGYQPSQAPSGNGIVQGSGSFYQAVQNAQQRQNS